MEGTADPFAFLHPGLATGIGSLPHADLGEAVAFAFARTPELPALPQPSAAVPLGGMIAQWARGIPGVAVRPDGSLAVDGVDPEAPVVPDLDHAGHAALRPFLRAAAARQGPLKLQVTGPVTLGLALVDAGAPRDVAFTVAGAATQANVAALLAVVRATPDLASAPVVLFLDEPSLVACAHPGFPVHGDAVAALIGRSIDAAGPGVLAGVHCCGATDFCPVVRAGARVLSLPATPGAALDAAPALRWLVENGGWIAWGAVPTTGPTGLSSVGHWRALNRLWADLAGRGIDLDLLRARALVTPVCGLAGHTTLQAGRILDLTVRLGRRIEATTR